MRTMRALILAMFIAGAPAAVAAQDRTANKQIGGWTVYCRADGMTDRLSCEMISVSRRAGSGGGATGPILLWRDAAEAPGVRLLKNGHVSVEGAFLRVGRGAPASFPNCRGRGGACMASIADDRRVGAEIASGAASALLRIGSLSSGEDWVFDFSEFAAAREELRRLRAAASLSMPARPFDELEREAIAAERQRADAAERAAQVAAAQERARTAAVERERRVTAACARTSAADRDHCTTVARDCAARGQDIAACIAPDMARRRLLAHLEAARQGCHARAESDRWACLRTWANCQGVDSIATFDACFMSGQGQ